MLYLFYSFTHIPIHSSTFICKTNPILPTKSINSFTHLLIIPYNYLSTKGALLLKKTQKMHAFCNSLKLTHLTPCVSKAYINISSQNTLHQSRAKSFTRLRRKICKTNPIYIKEKIGIYPYQLGIKKTAVYSGLNHRHTQYDIRNTSFFMQNEPNFTSPGLIFYVTNLLTYCVTNLLSYSYMQNEPNLKEKWP